MKALQPVLAKLLSAQAEEYQSCCLGASVPARLVHVPQPECTLSAH